MHAIMARMLPYVLSYAVRVMPEAAPAAKSEGCQRHNFGLGLRLGLGYGLGKICSFLWCTIFFVFSSLSPSPMVGPKWTEWIIETRTQAGD